MLVMKLVKRKRRKSRLLLRVSGANYKAIYKTSLETK